MTTLDTNVLVRILATGDSRQTEVANRLFRESKLVIPLIVFCEAAWVLKTSYGVERIEVYTLFERILDAPNVTCDKEAVRFGLRALARNHDFADAVLALEGARLGAMALLSFDKRCVKHLVSEGIQAYLLH